MWPIWNNICEVVFGWPYIMFVFCPYNLIAISLSSQVTTNKTGGMGGMLMPLIMYMAQSEEDGTMGILRCAADPDVKSGALYGPAGLTGGSGVVPHGNIGICTAKALVGN